VATIFITGGNRGIGLALARAYAAAGDRVIVGKRGSGGVDNFETISLDVADAASVRAAGDRLAHETIDVLINNAGVIGPGRQSTTDMDFDGFLETLAVNTVAPLRVTQAFLPALRRSQAAKLATITSQMGSLSYAKSDHVAYRASKAAANKVIQCLATDLAADAIAVAALHPGWVRTDMGGSGADIDVAESARGVKAVMDRLTLATTGRFWAWDGRELPW
jgi:NAD(P)-dependent dehydrogenase (short-subunit alcohol dehydrogenase family)